jgi:hypothetical protein
VEGVLQQFLMILKNISEIWNNKENKRKKKKKTAYLPPCNLSSRALHTFSSPASLFHQSHANLNFSHANVQILE